jgi:predicted secreted protein
MRALVSALALFAAATAAHAADGAQSRAIGYSPDGRYFAFEQYGIQDGSGYAYADLFVLDTKANTWAKGTPVHVLNENESGDIEAALASAAEKAAPMLKDLHVGSSYETLVHMPFTEIVAERRKVRFARYYDSMGNGQNYDATGSYVLEVRDVPLPRPAACGEDDGFKIVGVELLLTNQLTGKPVSVSKDAAIPKSRYCPHAYDIEAIYAPAVQGLQVEPLVAIIGVYSRGFEGSDRRFIAVPFELTE